MDNNKLKIIETKRNTITIIPRKLGGSEKVLDIGGGGEGIISKIYKDKVIAIDNRLDELLEVSETASLKMVMDATELSFIDNQFDRATAFFSLMYMSDDQTREALLEIHRVLKPNGILEIWDAEMPSVNDVAEEVFIVQLEIISEDVEIATGYGVSLKEEDRSLDYYEEVLMKSGFDVAKIMSDKGIIYIEAYK